VCGLVVVCLCGAPHSDSGQFKYRLGWVAASFTLSCVLR
jgi:hypothetical protein